MITESSICNSSTERLYVGLLADVCREGLQWAGFMPAEKRTRRLPWDSTGPGKCLLDPTHGSKSSMRQLPRN
jgi:hypothetical protein